jgi:Ser/Thr protein kinase RdoA (MazF antagonist)
VSTTLLPQLFEKIRKYHIPPSDILVQSSYTAPANLLVAMNQAVALLDFEFATPAARAMDVAQGLRMTTRVWENPDSWPVFRAFCRGYKHWNGLSSYEIEVLPWLMRLRTALVVVWWLGRMEAATDSAIVLRGITYLQYLSHWLQQHEQRLVDEVATILLR